MLFLRKRAKFSIFIPSNGTSRRTLLLSSFPLLQTSQKQHHQLMSAPLLAGGPSVQPGYSSKGGGSPTGASLNVPTSIDRLAFRCKRQSKAIDMIKNPTPQSSKTQLHSLLLLIKHRRQNVLEVVAETRCFFCRTTPFELVPLSPLWRLQTPLLCYFFQTHLADSLVSSQQ